MGEFECVVREHETVYHVGVTTGLSSRYIAVFAQFCIYILTYDRHRVFVVIFLSSKTSHLVKNNVYITWKCTNIQATRRKTPISESSYAPQKCLILKLNARNSTQLSPKTLHHHPYYQIQAEQLTRWTRCFKSFDICYRYHIELIDRYRNLSTLELWRRPYFFTRM